MAMRMIVMQEDGYAREGLLCKRRIVMPEKLENELCKRLFIKK
jgi:hypothetical protein